MALTINKVAQPDTRAGVTAAPYLPFLTFKSAIEALEQGIPKKIDRTIWRTQSGIVQTQILMALRFFGLVDDEDRPTDRLHVLVEDKESRAAILSTLLKSSYADLLKHDLTKMSPKMVEDEMEQYNVTGETKRKAVTFFLKAAKFADIPMHPLLSSQVRNTGPRKKRANKRNLDGATIAITPDTASGVTTKKTREIQLSSGGTVELSLSFDPFALTAADREFVYGLVDTLKAYEEANPPSEGQEEES